MTACHDPCMPQTAVDLLPTALGIDSLGEDHTYVVMSGELRPIISRESGRPS
jgi:hypothetical protein